MSKIEVMAILEQFAAGQLNMKEAADRVEALYPAANQPATNKHGQPIGDFPTDVPTDDEFNKYHATPVGYGEEGDWLIISKAVPVEKALELIQKECRDNYGLDEDYIPKTIDDLHEYDIGWGYDHDSYHYSEGGYWICDERNKVSRRWSAWGVPTQ